MSNASVSLSNRPLIPPSLFGLDTLTPAQQLALLMITDYDVANAVVKVLWHGTARPSWRIYAGLIEKGLARRKPDSYHAATPRGRMCGCILARSYADQLGIKINSGLTRRTLGSCTTAQFSA